MEIAEGQNKPISLMEILPIDIISNILARLPVKSLLCLKCVCKSWHTLISCSEFAHLHFRHSVSTNTNRYLIFSSGGSFNNDVYSYKIDSPELPAVNLPFPQKFDELWSGYLDIYVIGSCNGLVCVHCHDSKVIILNPSTRTYFDIPDPDACKPICPGYGASSYYGFGYDFCNDDYKFVRVSNLFSPSWLKEHCEIMVYSLKAKTWRLIGKYGCLGFFQSNGVLVNDHLLHWGITKRETQGHAMLCFDVSGETWSEFPFPDNQAGDWVKMLNLGNLSGCLCLLIKNDAAGNDLVEVWVMKEYGVKESWFKLLGIPDSIVTGSLCDPPIAYGKGEQEILVSCSPFLDEDGEEVSISIDDSLLV